MTLPLDDAQHARHTFRQLAEHMQILRQELVSAGFTGDLGDEMILIWWKSLVDDPGPDFNAIMRAIINPEGE